MIHSEIVQKPNGELRMSLEVFKQFKPDSIYDHLVKRAKRG